MWPILVEFHSASSAGSGRKKKIEERIAVKLKSADMYVGWPNNETQHYIHQKHKHKQENLP